MSTSVDTMKNFFNVLKRYSDNTTIDGVTVLDHAVKATTRFGNLQDAIDNFVADMAYATENFGAAESLKKNCGIVLGAENDFSVDTGSVSGSNAGMTETKNAQDIVPEPNVNLSELPLPAAGSKNFHTYTGSDGNSFSYTISYPNEYLEVIDYATASQDDSGSSDYSQVKTTYLHAGTNYSDGRYTNSGENVAATILNMIRGIENYWIDESLKLAYDSFGLDFQNKNINIRFGINTPYSADTVPTGYKDLDTFFAVDSIDMYINVPGRADLDPNDINGKSTSSNSRRQLYIDRIIAHEMTHAVMFGAGLFKNNMPQFFTEGVAELLHGSDDYNGGSTAIISGLAQDSERLEKALEFKSGTGTADAYPAGFMFLRYLCQQSQPVNVEFGSSESKTFTHSNYQDIINDYKDGDQINFSAGTEIVDVNTSSNDIFVSSNIGTAILRDTRGKVLNFADENGNVQTHALVANWAGSIDFRADDKKEIIYGADNADNDIWAGNGGSKLWGGNYGSDRLIGGNGVDEFISGIGNGNDSIFKANSEDTITLKNTTLDQILSAQINSDGVNISLTDGSKLNVCGNVGATFKLADGSTYLADQSSYEWKKTN
ncbi:MAG: hypothetical protein IK062_11160 [Selenomonadaceae bacterium]|nr:hypothetical protein [Selenomonadaceae bacterium]